MTIKNCTIIGDSAVFGGGIYCGYSDPTIENCAINGNSSGLGGGIFCIGYSEPIIKDCTLCENSAQGVGGGIFCGGSIPSGVNNIIWANTAPTGSQIYLDGGSFSCTYSDIQGGWPGEGNIDADPLFVTGPNGDYYLSQIASGQAVNSPCVDAGNPASAMIVGTTRTDGVQDEGVVDMGYHYSIPLPNLPEIVLSSDSLLFEDTIVGESDSLIFTIYNLGSADLIIWDIMNSLSEIFSTDWSPEDSVIVPGERMMVEVVFTPSDTLLYSDNLNIDNNDIPVSIYLLGTGIPELGLNDKEGELLLEFAFYPPHPNPFNQSTVVSYQLSAKSFVNLTVYDIAGREVVTLVDGYQDTGTHEIIFEAKDLVSGVYFVRLEAGEFKQTRKLLLIK